MKAHTKETQASITPEKALKFLKEGNWRFQQNLKANRNLLEQVNDTREGQFPFATVLSCIDSRTSAELIFDQGLGDIFSIRIAGNFINEDILGSMEFACKIAGTKLILVLGHTACGAIKGACDHVKMGNLTCMLEKIEPALEKVQEPVEADLRTSANSVFVDLVAEENVKLSIQNILKQSPILKEMVDQKKLLVVGAMYDISSGEVSFYC